MNDTVVFVSRVLRLPLLGLDGEPVGKVDDLVVGPPLLGGRPAIVGLVATMSRRPIFVAGTRIADITPSGVTLRQAALDLRPFKLRAGERPASALLNTRRGADVVVDIGIARSMHPAGAWEVAAIAIGRPGALRRRGARVVPASEVPDLFATDTVGRDIAALRAMHPSDKARAVAQLPAERRHEVTDAMPDEELADLLEELPEPEQARIITELDTDRAADVLEEMQPDDAADLLSELPAADRTELLEAMDPDEADPLRRLLLFDNDSAGGLMNPEPIVLPPEATVAEALARVREEHVPSALAACVFVAQPPTQTPTGPYLGHVTFQSLLREPPGEHLGKLADSATGSIGPDLPEIEVASRLAAYNLLSLAVCDEAGRLLGAVTVDDVLDRTLPAGWRSR